MGGVGATCRSPASPLSWWLVWLLSWWTAGLDAGGGGGGGRPGRGAAGLTDRGRRCGCLGLGRCWWRRCWLGPGAGGGVLGLGRCWWRRCWLGDRGRRVVSGAWRVLVAVRLAWRPGPVVGCLGLGCRCGGGCGCGLCRSSPSRRWRLGSLGRGGVAPPWSWWTASQRLRCWQQRSWWSA